MIDLLSRFAAGLIDPGDIENVPTEPLTSNSIQDGLQIFFAITAAVALLIVVISALRITISRGNSQDVQKARDAIIYASIGLAVTMSGFAVVTFVIGRL